MPKKRGKTMKKKIWIFTLVLALVFSLTLGTFTSALNAEDTGSGLTEDEQIQRGLMWEELNSLVYEISERFLSENVTGNYFTGYYYNTLKSACDYAQYLLEAVDSTYQQLKDMAADLRYLDKESDNPANHELAFHYTVAFTNTRNWDDPIYVYAWSKSGIQEFSWPGMGLTSSYTNEFGQKQYFAYIGEEYDYVIFSSGSQTVDIPLYDKTGYYPTGEVDAKGNYKVGSWHLNPPRYPEYTIPTEPTEAPTQSPTAKPTEPHTVPTNIDIDDYLPKYDQDIQLKLRSAERALQSQLSSLIVDTDRMLSAPGNSFDEDYIECVKRTRNFSAFVYNDDRAADHELTGAIRSLELAVEGADYYTIVDCLRQYFIFADDIEKPTEATQATEPTEANYVLGEVLVMLDSGSASVIGDLLKDFEIEDIHLLTPASNLKIFQVKFKEKTKEIVWQAIEVLSASPYVKTAEPNYLGSYAVLDDEASYNRIKDELEAEAYSIREAGDSDTGYYYELGQMISGVRHSVYELNGREFVSDHWIDKISLLYRLQNAIKVYKDSTSTDEDYQVAVLRLSGEYWALIPPEPQYKRGDADGDGEISVLDATVIQKVLASVMTDEHGYISYRGDVTGDGLDITDATAIQKYLAGLSNIYAINEYIG